MERSNVFDIRLNRPDPDSPTSQPELTLDEIGALNRSKREQQERDAQNSKSAIRRGAEAGIDQLQGIGYGLQALVAEKGSEQEARAIEGVQRNQEEAQFSLGDTESDGWADYVLRTVGQQLPMLIPTLVAGIATGGVGAAAMQAAVKAGGTGLIKKQAAKAIAEKAAKIAAQTGIGQAEAKRIAAQQLVKSTARMSAQAGATVGSVGLSTGIVAGGQAQVDGEIDPVSTIIGGTVSGIVGAAPIAMLFGKIGMPVEAVRQGIMSRAAGILAESQKMGLSEGATEVVQGMIEQSAINFIDDNRESFTLSDLTTLEQKVEEFGVGWLMGSMLGAIGGGGRSTLNGGMREDDIASAESSIDTANDATTISAAAERAANAMDEESQRLQVAAAEEYAASGDDHQLLAAKQVIKQIANRREALTERTAQRTQELAEIEQKRKDDAKKAEAKEKEKTETDAQPEEAPTTEAPTQETTTDEPVQEAEADGLQDTSNDDVADIDLGDPDAVPLDPNKDEDWRDNLGVASIMRRPSGATPKQRAAKRRKVDPAKDDLLTAISKLGGLDVDESSDFAGRLSHVKTPVGMPNIEQTGGKGKSVEALAEELIEMGYLKATDIGNGVDTVELYEKLERAAAGEQILSLEADAEENARQLHRDDIERLLGADPQEDIDAIDRLNSFIGERKGTEGEYVKPAELDQEGREFQQAVALAFNKRVAPFEASRGAPTGGFDPNNPNILLVAVNGKNPYSFVSTTGHELNHALRQDRPDLYDWVKSHADKYIQNREEYETVLNSSSEDSVTEEIISDFAGEALADPVFVNKLAKDNPSLFQDLADAVINFIESIKSSLKSSQSPKSDKFISDVEALRDVYQQALTAYATDQGVVDGVVEPNQDAVNFSEGGIKLSESAAANPPMSGRAHIAGRNTEGGFASPDEGWKEVVVRKMQDKYKVLKDLQANIVKSGGEIANQANAYLAEELFHDKVKTRIEDAENTYIKPLTAKLAQFKISIEDLDKFLIASHATERNEYIASINDQMPDGGSGLTNQQASDALAEIEEQGKQGHYEELSQIVYDMLAARRELLAESGLIEQQQADAWQDMYTKYVPLKGFADDEAQNAIPRTGKGFSIGGREVKAATGRGEGNLPSSATANTINDLTESLVRSEKNVVGNAFLKMVQDNPSPDYWQTFTNANPDMTRTPVQRKNPEDPDGPMITVVEDTPIPMAMMGDQYFQTKIDGETHYVKLADERLMKAMNNLGAESQNGLVRMLGTYTRFLSAMNTSLNPEFIVSNFLRDPQTAVLNILAEQTRDDGKIVGQDIAVKVAKDIFPAMKGIYTRLRNNEGGGEWGDVYREFRETGGGTGFYDSKDIDGQIKRLNNLVTMADGSLKGKAFKVFDNTAQFIEDANGSVENAVRLSSYKHSRDAFIEAGLDPQDAKMQAASFAKNLTVNFNRRGEVGTTLNALYMFANASIQGTANFARTMVNLKGPSWADYQASNPEGSRADFVKHKARWDNFNNAQKMAVGIMAGSFGLALANRQMAGEDEDGVNYYDKVPDYVKERNLVIMKSLFGGDEGEYIKIPLPYGYNVFSVFGTSMEAITSGPDDVTKHAGRMALSVLGSFSPIGFSDSDSATGLLLKNAAPTISKPFVDVAMNENFFGGTIYNENFPFGTQKPNSQLGRQSTGAVWKGAAEFMNKVTGGSDHRPGGWDYQPEVMRHFLDSVVGGSGSFFEKTLDAGIKTLNGVPQDAQRIPFYGRVAGVVTPYQDQDTFYTRREELAQYVAESKALAGTEKQEFDAEYGDLIKLAPMMKSAQKQLKTLRKERDKYYASDMSMGDKAARITEVKARMKSVYDAFNKQWGEAEQ